MKRNDMILAAFGSCKFNMANFHDLILLQMMKGGSSKHLDEQMAWFLGMYSLLLYVVDILYDTSLNYGIRFAKE